MFDILSFKCPYCNKVTYIPKEVEPLGKKKICKQCQKVFVLSEKNQCPLPQKPSKMGQTSKDIHSNYAWSNFEREKEFDRYQIIKLLGAGSMGKVYKVYDPTLDKCLALKKLTAGARAPEKDEKRFLREAQAVSTLQHPHIVRVYEVGYHAGQYFFTMELIEGISLEQILLSKPLEQKKCLEIFLKVASAMQHAHSLGIVHRDLKPGNIMVDSNWEPKVVDFGLVKFMEKNNTMLTSTGVILGTLLYMPPEQASGKVRDIDQRSDLYALGVILYQILTGRVPFDDKSKMQLICKILYQEPEIPSNVNPQIPPMLSQICLKLLEKEKQNRFQNVDEFIEQWKRVF